MIIRLLENEIPNQISLPRINDSLAKALEDNTIVLNSLLSTKAPNISNLEVTDIVYDDVSSPEPSEKNYEGSWYNNGVIDIKSEKELDEFIEYIKYQLNSYILKQVCRAAAKYNMEKHGITNQYTQYENLIGATCNELDNHINKFKNKNEIGETEYNLNVADTILTIFNRRLYTVIESIHNTYSTKDHPYNDFSEIRIFMNSISGDIILPGLGSDIYQYQDYFKLIVVDTDDQNLHLKIADVYVPALILYYIDEDGGSKQPFISDGKLCVYKYDTKKG